MLWRLVFFDDRGRERDPPAGKPLKGLSFFSALAYCTAYNGQSVKEYASFAVTLVPQK